MKMLMPNHFLLTFLIYRGIISYGESVFLESRTGRMRHGLRAHSTMSSKQGTLLDLTKSAKLNSEIYLIKAETEMDCSFSEGEF